MSNIGVQVRLRRNQSDFLDILMSVAPMSMFLGYYFWNWETQNEILALLLGIVNAMPWLCKSNNTIALNLSYLGLR